MSEVRCGACSSAAAGGYRVGARPERQLAALSGWRHLRCEDREEDMKGVALLVAAATLVACPVRADSSTLLHVRTSLPGDHVF